MTSSISKINFATDFPQINKIYEVALAEYSSTIKSVDQSSDRLQLGVCIQILKSIYNHLTSLKLLRSTFMFSILPLPLIIVLLQPEVIVRRRVIKIHLFKYLFILKSINDCLKNNHYIVIIVIVQIIELITKFADVRLNSSLARN